MVYIEVNRNYDSDLWKTYKPIAENRNNFNIGKIREVNQIWEVFRDFFKKNVTNEK